MTSVYSTRVKWVFPRTERLRPPATVPYNCDRNLEPLTIGHLHIRFSCFSSLPIVGGAYGHDSHGVGRGMEGGWRRGDKGIISPGENGPSLRRDRSRDMQVRLPARIACVSASGKQIWCSSLLLSMSMYVTCVRYSTLPPCSQWSRAPTTTLVNTSQYVMVVVRYLTSIHGGAPSVETRSMAFRSVFCFIFAGHARCF